MEFSSLVLMEKDPETNMFLKELDSFEIYEGAEYVKKLYCISNVITLYFDTLKDVEEWEYTAIFDLFDSKSFTDKGYTIEDYEEEFNPTWVVQFKYEEKYEKNKEKINFLCKLIEEQVNKVFINIQNKKNDYI